MITKFNTYITESIRDKMTGVSEEEVLKGTEGLSPFDKFIFFK